MAFSVIKCSAQIGVRLIQFRPAGQQGFAMNKTLTGEIMYIENFNEANSTRARLGICFAALKARLDTFPLTAVKESGNTTSILPGYEVFHKYNVYFLFAGVDYPVLKHNSFYLFPGIDFLIGGIDMKYDLYYETFKEESFTGGNILVGFRLRAGAEYEIAEKAGVFLEVTRNMYFVEDQGFLSHNDIGLGFRYNFNL